MKQGMFLIGRVVGSQVRITKSNKEVPEVMVLIAKDNGGAAMIHLVDFDRIIKPSEKDQTIPFYVQKYRDQETGKQYVSYVVKGERNGNTRGENTDGVL